VTLGLLYHMPFWQTADGALWEAEGSFARYVDSLAPFFDEILLAVPVFDVAPASGSRVRASNVRLAPLPYFPGPRQFYPRLLSIYWRLRTWARACDVLHLRVPTPAGVFAYSLGKRLRKPTFLLVVGDYQALLPHLPYRGLKRLLFTAYVAFEELALSRMTRGALTFVNGAALRAKHERDGARVFETRTTTLSREDVATRSDTCTGRRVRLLTVSRIDPRKGLRTLPTAVAALVAGGQDVTIDIVGPTIGQIGDEERAAIVASARQLGVADRVRLTGAIPLDRLMQSYRDYDVFVLPTRPGEGIPRVLMEAMAAGLPVITTDVSGIGSLVEHERNGILIESNPDAVAAAVSRVIHDSGLRQRLIAGGYHTARHHTLEHQAEQMMRVVERELGLGARSAPTLA
jgi:phosphatidyl-myo-inositol dimannoside synthase